MRAIFYDTETTGLNPSNDRIIEIAAYDPKEDRSFEYLVNPGIPIPPEATAIHKITDEMVSESPDFREVGNKFIEFCDGDVVLIAHNNDNFDVHFLRNEFKRHDIQMSPWKFLDSLKWARRYRPDLPKHSLPFLREIYRIPENNAHRALDDVIVLHKVFSLMTDDLPMEEIYSLLNSPRKISHMPFGKHQGKPLDKVPDNYVRWLASSGALDKTDNQELHAKFKELGKL